jgi:hypothetical protein
MAEMWRLSTMAIMPALGAMNRYSVCSTLAGPTGPCDRVDYANALSESWKDQMLQDLALAGIADPQGLGRVSRS